MTLYVNHTTVNVSLGAGELPEKEPQPLCSIIWGGRFENAYLEDIFYMGIDPRDRETPYSFKARIRMDSSSTPFIVPFSLDVRNPQKRTLERVIKDLALRAKKYAAQEEISREICDEQINSS